MNAERLSKTTPKESKFTPEPTTEEKARLIDAANGATLPESATSRRFFELRGLLNRGQVGQQLVWNALQNAKREVAQ